jgi:hypothetical protein
MAWSIVGEVSIGSTLNGLVAVRFDCIPLSDNNWPAIPNDCGGGGASLEELLVNAPISL